MLHKLDNAVFFNGYIVFVNEDSDNVTFFGHEMSLNAIYPNDIDLDDNNFDNYDPETTINVRFMDWCDRYKQRKTCKKLLSVAYHPTRWWGWYMSKKEKKKKKKWNHF